MHPQTTRRLTFAMASGRVPRSSNPTVHLEGAELPDEMEDYTLRKSAYELHAHYRARRGEISSRS
jgi:hypothetical protein